MNEQNVLQQVIELLKQGMQPEELIKMGVPKEIIQQAMSTIQQEAQSGQMQQPAPEQLSGLAGINSQQRM